MREFSGAADAAAVESESGIAAKMAQDIATSVLAGQAANLTDPVFASLGIDQSSSDASAYYKKVLGELTKIEGDLAAIATKIEGLSLGVIAIQNALTGISSQISDAELQSQLAQYTENKNIINQNYESYANALSAMGNVSTFEAGTSALFALFQENNADAVATAMANVHDLLTGAGELRGILSYQLDEVSRAYAAMASDPKQTTTVRYSVNVDYSDWSQAFPNGELILDAFPRILASTFDDTVIPTLKAALGVQMKGLSFLSAAWAGSVNEPSLAGVVARVQDVVQAIRQLVPVAAFDDMVSSALQAHCTRLSADALSASWYVLDANGDHVGSCPFDENWAFWNWNGMAAVTDSPWSYGSRGICQVFNKDTDWTGASYIAQFQMAQLAITLAKPSTYVAAPANFQSFVATLPGGP